MDSTSARHRWPLFALGVIIVVTVGWWAAALWPLPATTPDWVVRARAACFGSTESGLPNSGGWILLVGTPLSMLAALLVIAGNEVRQALTSLQRSQNGAWVIRTVAAGLIVLSGLAAVRVGSAYGLSDRFAPRVAGASLPDPSRTYGEAPPLELVDQHGDTIDLARFRGRTVLVTFAYGKCTTVCPVIVRSVLSAREELDDNRPVILIVTLDPWRDTPPRLAHIAQSWGVPGEVHVLGGSVSTVEQTLDGWGVERARDPRSGEIAHASLVLVVDDEGRLAFSVSGREEQITRAVRQLREAAGAAEPPPETPSNALRTAPEDVTFPGANSMPSTPVPSGD